MPYRYGTGAIIWLPQGQSYDCPSAIEVTLKDMGKIVPFHKDFPPSGEQPKQHELAHTL